jgi:hypothetical protein
MKSVALVGFSEKTMKFCLTSKADELWTLNHVYVIKDFPPVNRLFELHKKYWYLRKEVPRSVAYNEWLKEKHPFPIYMHRKRKEVPSSEKYPLKAVIEDCLSGLVEQDVNRKETVRKYFTSTFAYMMAMAIYEKFDVIELYGIDMENNTEYGYQRPCGEFWIGLAVGRGIKVILQEPCQLCDATLYGYETVPYIDVNRLKEIHRLYQLRYDEYYLKMGELASHIAKEPDNKELIDKYIDTSAWAYLHDGAITAATKLIEESDSYISRQFVEMKVSHYTDGFNYWYAKTNATKAIDHSLRERGIVDDNAWTDYLNARSNMYRNLGAIQLHQQLIWTIDMRQVDYVLHMEIVEKDDNREKEIAPYRSMEE